MYIQPWESDRGKVSAAAEVEIETKAKHAWIGVTGVHPLLLIIPPCPFVRS